VRVSPIVIGQYLTRKHTVRAFNSLSTRFNALICFILAGTAVLSKHKPISVQYTLPGHPNPTFVKGRIITLEFEGCYVIATYVVNAGVGLKVLHFSEINPFSPEISDLIRHWMRKQSGMCILKATFEI
jgi:exonuclease III